MAGEFFFKPPLSSTCCHAPRCSVVMRRRCSRGSEPRFCFACADFSPPRCCSRWAALEASRRFRTPPIVNAGDDQLITLPRDRVTFTASSSEPDGDALSFSWVGEGLNLEDALTASVSVVSLVPGNFVLRVTADDGHGGTSTDDVTLTVNAEQGRGRCRRWRVDDEEWTVRAAGKR